MVLKKTKYEKFHIHSISRIVKKNAIYWVILYHYSFIIKLKLFLQIVAKCRGKFRTILHNINILMK